jgi:hypothetical protein
VSTKRHVAMIAAKCPTCPDCKLSVALDCEKQELIAVCFRCNHIFGLDQVLSKLQAVKVPA